MKYGFQIERLSMFGFIDEFGRFIDQCDQIINSLARLSYNFDFCRFTWIGYMVGRPQNSYLPHCRVPKLLRRPLVDLTIAYY